MSRPGDNRLKANSLGVGALTFLVISAAAPLTAESVAEGASGQPPLVVGEPIDPNEVAKTYAGRGVDAVTDAIRDAMQNLKNELERMP